jgi:hypothetical protein
LLQEIGLANHLRIDSVDSTDFGWINWPSLKVQELDAGAIINALIRRVGWEHPTPPSTFASTPPMH